MLHDAHKKGQHARQMMAQANGSAGWEGIDLGYRANVGGQPLERPNVNGNGTLTCPTKQWCASGAFDILRPRSKEFNPGHQADETRRGRDHFGHALHRTEAT